MKLAIAAFLLLFSIPSLAQVQAQSNPPTDDTVILDAQIRMPIGISEFQFDLAENSDAHTISIWYERTLLCGGFGIHGVEVEYEEGLWHELKVQSFQGVAYFQPTQEFQSIRLRVESDLMRRCNIQVVSRDERLPQIFKMLVKVHTACTPGMEGTCNFDVERIDEAEAAMRHILEEQALSFNLIHGAIYKVEGYDRTTEEGEAYFHLLKAERIM